MSSNSHPPLIIFHRANTLELCQYGLDQKVQMIEFDIRKTKDEILILFHDPVIGDHEIRNLTYRELQNLSPNLKIPTLTETLRFLQGKTYLDVELKEAGYESRVVREVLKYFSPKELIFTSFKEEVVQVIKKKFSPLKVGLLVAKKWPNKKMMAYIPVFWPILKAKRAGADFIAPHYHLFKLGLLKRAFKEKFPVYVWTVNQEKKICKYLQDPRIHAVITDHLSFALKEAGL